MEHSYKMKEVCKPCKEYILCLLHLICLLK